MALPSFYNQADQDIYASGDKFIPQERYRLGYTAPPSIANASTGITNTQAASPYIWPPKGGGGGSGSGGGGLYGNLDLSKTKDFTKNVYVDQGPKKGWQKQAVTGYYNPTLGNWQTLKGKNINHLGIEVPTLMGTIINKMSGKKFGEPEVGDIQGTFTNDPSGDIAEEDAIAKAALHRNRINKIIQTGIYNKDYVPKGGGGVDVKDIPAGDGGYTPGDNTINWDSGITGTKDFHPSQGNAQPHGTDTSGSFAGKGSSNPFGRAQGGRIGYRNGEFVEDINVEGPGFDENVEMASDPSINAELYGMYLDALDSGEIPKETTFEMFKEFMSEGSSQDQGIASLV